MIGNKVEQSDLIGDIEGFPIEVVKKMVDEQFRQGNDRDVSVFQGRASCARNFDGFTWNLSSEGRLFCEQIILYNKFDIFFNKYPKQQIKMEEKTIKISVPEGYEVDEENSTFAEIKFKPIVSKYPKSWPDAFVKKNIRGYFVNNYSIVSEVNFVVVNADHGDKNVFKTEKQAKSMLAYAQITQLMALPCYNGDWVPDWANGCVDKYVIGRSGNKIIQTIYARSYEKLAFRSADVRDAFYSNHMDLLKTYFELD